MIFTSLVKEKERADYALKKLSFRQSTRQPFSFRVKGYLILESSDPLWLFLRARDEIQQDQCEIFCLFDNNFASSGVEALLRSYCTKIIKFCCTHLIQVLITIYSSFKYYQKILKKHNSIFDPSHNLDFSSTFMFDALFIQHEITFKALALSKFTDGCKSSHSN